MIIRDDSAKSGDLGRPLTEEEEKIFAKLKEGLQM